MRLWCPGSSQLSCHNQTDPLPRRWSIARVWRGRWCAFQPRAPEWAGRSLKTNRAPWGTCRRAAGGASQKGPAIGDGSQSSEKRQSKSFRGRAKEGNCLRTSRALQKAGRPARSGPLFPVIASVSDDRDQMLGPWPPAPGASHCGANSQRYRYGHRSGSRCQTA
jgi:hypothetical protein